MTTAVVSGIAAMRRYSAALLVLLLTLPAWAFAAEDPPGRVARLSLIEGEVSIAPAGTQEWGEAVLNRPLTSEDRLFVDRDARAELQVGSATIHLDASTEFSFIDLDDDAMTMKLTEGHATIRILRKRDKEDIEINTPNASVALLRPGEYHIEVDPDGEITVVKTRSGEAEVAGEGDSYTVRANEMGVFRGSDELKGDISSLGPRTAFEDWANERARRNERSASSRYVGDGVVGYEDLDEHGHWAHEPEYGYIWRPTYVAAGWAPYRYGRWAWVSPWGWTWIDDARWGFAPFHYGRWAYVSHRWCWVPGPRHVRAVYAPALVAWVGGPHVSVNIALGHGVGWFPLGPREVYVPGYWHTRHYINRVNVSNTIIVNNTYINNAYRGRYRDFDYRYRERPEAVTVVERDHFVRGRPIGGHAARVDDRELRRWGHDARPPAIAPERDSVLAGTPRMPRTLDTAREPRSVVTRREWANRVSFDDERRAVEANGGRPVARTALIDRNPKKGSDYRVARSRRVDGDPRVEGNSPANAVGRGPRATAQQPFERAPIERRTDSARPRDEAGQALERMRATESAGEIHTQRESSRERVDGARAPSLDTPSQSRRERNSSDWAAERLQRQQLEQPRAVEPRQREPQREIVREAQRVQREAWQAERAMPRAEPRSDQRERTYAQPERQAQPRMEAQPSQQPRIERSQSNPKEGHSSNHMRIERGGQRER
jgi:hypothetical protein